MKRNFIRELLIFTVINISFLFLLSQASKSSPAKMEFPAICSAILAFMFIIIERLRRRVEQLERILKMPPSFDSSQQASESATGLSS
jgi:hypothetical protein